jgi:hypothetical protein
MCRSRFFVSLSCLLAAVVLFALAGCSMTASSRGPGTAAEKHTSAPFAGVKANRGTVTHTRDGGVGRLTLSDDFVVPDTPDPHWQLVSSGGQTFLLQRLPVKGDKVNRSIAIPAHVPDVARVQIWCAFAETLLGEAAFASPVR